MNQTDKDTEMDQLKRENRELKEKVKYLESAQNEKFLELENENSQISQARDLFKKSKKLRIN